MSVHINRKAATAMKEPFTLMFGLRPRQKRRAICGKLRFIQNTALKRQKAKLEHFLFSYNLSR